MAAGTDSSGASAQAEPPAVMWYWAADNVRHGPISADDLLNGVLQGRVTTWAMVWRQGMTNWQTMADVPELRTQLMLRGVPMARPAPAPARRLGDDPGMRMLLPVGRSGYAIASGYLGLVSMIPILAPLAILFGILAIVEIRKRPDLHGMGRAVFGIAMGAICLIGFLVLLAMGKFS